MTTNESENVDERASSETRPLVDEIEWQCGNHTPPHTARGAAARKTLTDQHNCSGWTSSNSATR